MKVYGDGHRLPEATVRLVHSAGEHAATGMILGLAGMGCLAEQHEWSEYKEIRAASLTAKSQGLFRSAGWRGRCSRQ